MGDHEAAKCRLLEFIAELCPMCTSRCCLAAFPQYPSMWSADLIDRARERVWTDWIRRTCIPTFMRVLRARQEEKLEASSLELCRVLDILAAEVSSHAMSSYSTGACPCMATEHGLYGSRSEGPSSQARTQHFQILSLHLSSSGRE